MNTLIAAWLQDQIEECPEAWDFPDNFDADKASQFICDKINGRLDELLTEYLWRP